MRFSMGGTWNEAIPVPYRANFLHLILDIAWFGVLNGSAIAFIAVFAVRQGATAEQVSLLSASPAVMTLILAVPAGRWLQKRPVSRGVFFSSIANRWFYLLWVFLPMAFPAALQVRILIAITLLMSIPGTALAIGFNALFASAVPAEWRATVVGLRNAAYALTSIVVTLICGRLIQDLPFPLGYQVVFAIGFVAAMFSSFHLWHVRPPMQSGERATIKQRTRDWAQPGISHFWHSLRTFIGLRYLMFHNYRPHFSLRFLDNNRRYGIVLILVFSLHLALTLAGPLFPLYLVNNAHFTDQDIAVGNSVFYLALFLGSTRLAVLSARFGNRRTLAVGMMLSCLYPLLVAHTEEIFLYIMASIMGGVAWSMAGGALGNFVLEEIPEGDQERYLAWYNIGLQSGVLLGALLAPIIVSWVGIVYGLIIAAASRLLSGVGIWYFRSSKRLAVD